MLGAEWQTQNAKKKIRNIFSIVYVLRRLYKKAKAKAD